MTVTVEVPGSAAAGAEAVSSVSVMASLIVTTGNDVSLETTDVSDDVDAKIIQKQISVPGQFYYFHTNTNTIYTPQAQCFIELACD